MGTGELTLWNSGVWLIPIILLAILVGLYLLVRQWQKKSQQNLKDLRGELRRIQTSYRQVDQALQEYSREDPEPYGARAAAVHDQLDELAGRIADIEAELVSINERARRLVMNRWQGMVGAPYPWYLLRKDIARLRRNLKTYQSALSGVAEQGENLRRIPWEVAQQARQLRVLQQQAGRVVDKLRAQYLSGNAMESAIRRSQEYDRALAEIPRYFLFGEEANVLDQADKETTARVHAIAAKIKPRLEELSGQAQAWEKQHAEAVESVAAMRQQLGNTEQALGSLPSGLDLTSLNNQFDQISIIASNLHATLARLEAESISSVIEESKRVQQAGQDLEGQIRQTRQKLAALEQILPELNEGLKQTAALVAEMGTHPTSPVVWEQSSVQLTNLNREVAAIGAAAKPRSPEKVEQDLASAARLNGQQKELARHCQQIAQQHAELLKILSAPELSEGLQWQQEALQVAEQVYLYDPENWPRGDAVANLPGELEALGEGLHMLVASGKPKQIPESELGQRLENARELARFAAKLRTRLVNVQKRLAELQESEKQAQEKLDEAHKALNQMGHLVRSNPLLTEIAAQEVSRYQTQVRQLSEDFDQTERGSIEKKAKAVSVLVGRIEASGNSWLDHLTKDLQGQKKVLSEQLAELEAIAALDEPAISEAQRMLAESQAFMPAALGPKSRYRLEEIILELKRRSEFWQNCIATVRAVEDVEGPVVETYHEVNQYREYVKQQVGEMEGWMRNAKLWPPVSVTMTTERQELARIEEQWQGLKSQPTKAISVVAHLGSLSAKYQALSEKVRTLTDRAVDDQEKIEGVEAELDDLAQLWQAQWQAYRDNPIATSEIRRLLGDIAAERSQLKQEYRQGAKDYGQVLQALQLLHRRARMAQASIDDNHVIDVNGRVIAYR